MLEEKGLRLCAPEALGNARAMAHKAVQFLTKAARANLPAEPDDGHSNLGWDSRLKGFMSQPIASHGAIYFVGISFSPLELGFFRHDQPVSELDLENVSENSAAAWLDVQLGDVGLKSASAVALPYDLPPEVAAVGTFRSGTDSEALSALTAWFDLAHGVLSDFAAGTANLVPGPSPVRCWPHHFDLATYVGLEAGDAEAARGIGVGMSPGDESYDQPYFYINPWPHLNREDLPELPAPGHWHTDGFVGAIATAEQVLALSDIGKTLPVFVNGAFAIGQEKLGV